jgi:hypothetical protein
MVRKGEDAALSNNLPIFSRSAQRATQKSDESEKSLKEVKWCKKVKICGNEKNL